MSEPVDFLLLESLIVERLKSLLPANTRVLTADDLEGVKAADQPVPAVHVIYAGMSGVQTNASGTQAELDQDFLIVCVIKHMGAAPKAAAEQKQRIAPLVNGVLRALMGWRPSSRPGTPGLKLKAPPNPIPKDGFYYFPLKFSGHVAVLNA